MNKVEIFFRHDAELDAFNYFEYLYERNPDAATRPLEAIDQTVQNLAMNPLKGFARKFSGKDLNNIRSWRVDGFENYLIFYRFTGMTLDILRIRHGAMRFPQALRKS